MNDYLSEHFSLPEFVVSQTAIRKGIDNTPPSQAIINLQQLCIHVLEPIRKELGVVNVSSGYRCPKLNKAIGGAATSQHTEGKAADITVSGKSVAEVFEYVRKSGIDFDQMINEFDGAWLHISFNLGNNRRECLLAKKIDGKTVYVKA